MQHYTHLNTGSDTSELKSTVRPDNVSQCVFINDINDYAAYDQQTGNLNFLNVPASMLGFEESFFVLLSTPVENRGFIKVLDSDTMTAPARAHLEELEDEGFQVLYSKVIA